MHSMASDLGLHCSAVSHLRDSRHKLGYISSNVRIRLQSSTKKYTKKIALRDKIKKSTFECK